MLKGAQTSLTNELCVKHFCHQYVCFLFHVTVSNNIHNIWLNGWMIDGNRWMIDMNGWMIDRNGWMIDRQEWVNDRHRMIDNRIVTGGRKIDRYIERLIIYSMVGVRRGGLVVSTLDYGSWGREFKPHLQFKPHGYSVGGKVSWRGRGLATRPH